MEVNYGKDFIVYSVGHFTIVAHNRKTKKSQLFINPRNVLGSVKVINTALLDLGREERVVLNNNQPCLMFSKKIYRNGVVL